MHTARAGICPTLLRAFIQRLWYTVVREVKNYTRLPNTLSRAHTRTHTLFMLYGVGAEA